MPSEPAADCYFRAGRLSRPYAACRGSGPTLPPYLQYEPEPRPGCQRRRRTGAVRPGEASGHASAVRGGPPRTVRRTSAIRTSPSPLLWLEQLVTANLGTLFPGMQVVQSHPFRVTRDAEVSIQELEAEDLLETIERGVRQRRFGRVVRLTVDTRDAAMQSATSSLRTSRWTRGTCTPWSLPLG